MEVPNIVMKFHNFDIFYKIGLIFDLSSALACRVGIISKKVFFNYLNAPFEIGAQTFYDVNM